MIITFYSNYLTHHQIPFCNILNKMDDVEFHFVSTEPMEEERKNGGWAFEQTYPYELRSYESKENERSAEELAVKSDAIIIGSAPEKYVSIRMKNAPNKLTFRYSERIYKRGRWRVLSPRGVINRFKTYFRYINNPLYMLCASSFTAGDLAMLGSYIGRCYKWGYFPQTEKYDDIERIIEEKQPASILWAGRLIGWKHPELVLQLAERLKNDKIGFHINIVGDGPLKNDLQIEIERAGLRENVSLIGAVPSSEVRRYMEKSVIFLSTSDQNEGWGAVLNEAMNSGCAVVASKAVGAAAFLIKDGKNGAVFNNKKVDDLYKKVKTLLIDNTSAKEYGAQAYRTIVDLWSAEVAAKRFIELSRSLIDNKKIYFENGPASKAYIT